MKDLTNLPSNLPVPVDDGACDHLVGSLLPSISLEATTGARVNLADFSGTVVVYFYPMIGRPDGPPMVGWNEIPGARGCTPQSCGYRDHYTELMSLVDYVYGVSAQPLEDQKEAKTRLELPFELLNDSDFKLSNALKLPTFEYQGMRLIKRLTMIAVNGTIKKVFYPVFPPDQDVVNVLEWLQNSAA